MSTTTHTDPTASVQTIALDQVDVGANVRDLDPEHVAALAASIALRGWSSRSRSAPPRRAGKSSSPARTATPPSPGEDSSAEPGPVDGR